MSRRLDHRPGRGRPAAIVGLVGLAVILVALVRVQLVDRPTPIPLGTRIEPRVVPAVRGAILDRHGRNLADAGDTWTVRSYPAGAAAAHVVGTVGPRSSADERPGFPGSAGRMGGTSGVELRYDRRLAGRDGLRYVEIDGEGRVVGAAPIRREVPPTPGEPLRLALDLWLQQAVAGAIPEGQRAAVAALDPATGAIRVLYSSPGFDPNRVSGPSFSERWAELTSAEDRPDLNRAIGRNHSTGSVGSVATAATAIRLGVADAGTTMPLPCRGGLAYGGRYLGCSRPDGHGSLPLWEAVAQGCDVFFYQLALQIGLERLIGEGSRMGLGRSTGVDLAGETPPLFPGSPSDVLDLAERTEAHAAMLLAAGQSGMATSALKMAHLFASLVMDGPAPLPRLVPDATGASRVLPEPGLTQEHALALRSALPGRGVADGSVWGWRGLRGWVGDPGLEWSLGLAGPAVGPPELVVAVVIEGFDPNSARAVAQAVVDMVVEAGSGRTGQGARPLPPS
jgi:penicillin-binding protein 2